MASLSVALSTANSGLMAAQIGLSTVSDNISNVNTPGYVRKTVEQQQNNVQGTGAGVQVIGIKRVADQYLQFASLSAGADASRYSAYSQYMDDAQSLFGDPSASTSFFNSLNTVYTDFASASNDPSNNLLRTQAVSDVQSFLSQAGQINGQLTQLSTTVDSRVTDDVNQVNSLLSQISSLNGAISRAALEGGDASGAENMQSQLLDQLSGLISVKAAQRSGGGVDVRSPEGVLLAGDQAATLTYNSSASTPGYISAVPAGGIGSAQPIQVSSGEVRGLLDLRNSALPGVSAQLGQFVSQAVQQLNDAHNASSAVPAPASLTGRNTGLDPQSAASNFTGAATIAIVDSSGVVQHTVAVDFTAGTISVDGGAASAMTPATFVANLNTALGTVGGSASFSGGALTINAPAGSGVAIDEGTSQKAGRGFSAFYGLNDLVQSTGVSNYETGLSSADADAFPSPSNVTFRVSQPDGKPIRDITVDVSGASVGTMLGTLNSSASGLGLYGTFALDGNGALTFSPSAPYNANLSVVQDQTSWNGTGPSFSQLFGVGMQTQTALAASFSVNPAIVADPTKLALAQLNLAAPAGQPALVPGDGAGALAISKSGDVTTNFQAAGALGQVNMTVSRYAAEFGASVGQEASAAASQSKSASAVQTEADSRRSSVESVNLDEELVHLQTYQQAYNASARMIQATSDLFNTLMTMVSGL